MKQAKILAITIVCSCFLIFGYKHVFAHPGNTDAYGCHTCRTNCISWGLSYGEYHCHNPKIDYTPSTPTCPIFSSYDSLSGSCKCMYGYVVGTDLLGNQSCVSGDQKCQDNYGYGAQYDSLSNKCECKYGYLMSGGKCIDDDLYCRDTYSYSNSRYNSLLEKCECNYGYEYDGSSCVYKSSNYGYSSPTVDYSKLQELLSQYYQNSCPLNSKLVGSDCHCDDGYIVNSEKNGCEKLVCPTNAVVSEHQCVCMEGYVLSNNSCISYNQSCTNKYGQNSYGDKDYCYCKVGYNWNDDKTSCVVTNIIGSENLTDDESSNKYVFSKPLKLGSRGDEVTKLQELLLNKKFLKTKIFGYFGAATKTAVIKFQKANKVKQSGWLDKTTIELLNNQ